MKDVDHAYIGTDCTPCTKLTTGPPERIQRCYREGRVVVGSALHSCGQVGFLSRDYMGAILSPASVRDPVFACCVQSLSRSS